MQIFLSMIYQYIRRLPSPAFLMPLLKISITSAGIVVNSRGRGGRQRKSRRKGLKRLIKLCQAAAISL